MQTPTTNRAETRSSYQHGRGSVSHLLERVRCSTVRVNALQGFSTQWLIAGFAIALLLIFLRDPSLFARPQFWAEDGKVWYAQAYNQGWLYSLVQPLNGYLQTSPRLGAGAALLVPFHWAPLVMAFEGLLFQALPVPILLSQRCRNWAPLSFRLLFAAVYIAIPNAHEVHVLCTSCQWHLALVVVLLAFSAVPCSWLARSSEILLFTLGAVSGPFAIVITPLLLIFWWIRRQPWSLVLSSILAAGSIVQLVLLRHYETARNAAFLGASVTLFIRIVGGDIFWAALRGSRAYGYEHSLLPCLVVFLVGLAVIAYCLRKASLEVRLFFLFCFGILAAALRSPLLAPTPLPLWEHMLTVASLRYWYLPSLVLLWSLLWCACHAPSRIFRAIGVLLALLLVQGIVRDWRISPLEDLHFHEYAEQFEAAPRGVSMRIPLNPPPAWFMDIKKK